jgi:ketosteroid isomerase-like protein
MSKVADIEGTVRRMFASVDSMDAEENATFMTDDVELRFANSEAVIGKEAFTEASRQFLSSLKAIRHEIDSLWVVDDETAIAELTVHYTRHDGGEVTIPAADVLRLRDGLIYDYRILADLSPVFGG